MYRTTLLQIIDENTVSLLLSLRPQSDRASIDRSHVPRSCFLPTRISECAALPSPTLLVPSPSLRHCWPVLLISSVSRNAFRWISIHCTRHQQNLLYEYAFASRAQIFSRFAKLKGSTIRCCFLFHILCARLSLDRDVFSAITVSFRCFSGRSCVHARMSVFISRSAEPHIKTKWSIPSNKSLLKVSRQHGAIHRAPPGKSRSPVGACRAACACLDSKTATIHARR